MKIEYLLGLFELGQYKQCLAQLQDFLNVHANHTNALLLKAKCLFEISNSKYNRYYEAYDDFIKVLDADPTSLEALQYATYISVYIIKTDPEKSLELCNKWLDLAPQVHQVEALQYRAQAYRTSKNYPLALKDYDQLISIIQLVFADDRVKLDSALAVAYIEKGQTYLNDLNNPNVALQVFKDSFKYQLPDSQYYFDIASLAFSLQDFEFGGAVALRLFSSEQTVTPQQVRAVYRQIEELIELQVFNKNLVHAKLVAARSFREIVEVNPLDNLNFIRKCMAIYPDWYVPYHFYGAELFEAEGYHESLPYIKKSLELGGMAFDVSRCLEAAYRTKKQKLQIEHWPHDGAAAYYDAAKSFYKAELNLRDQENASWFLENRAKLYERSFDGFYSYFFRQEGLAQNNAVEVFSRCCNEYGIALTSLKRYEEADKIHSIGYAVFPFWEQLCSWSETLMCLRRYEEALIKVRQVLKLEKEQVDFDLHLQLRCREALALYHLGRISEAKYVFSTIEQEYAQFFVNNKVSESDNRILTERYADLQNVRFHLLEKETPEHAIMVWQQQLEKNPDDLCSWLMLMQKYYELNNDEQCIACANNYLALKGGALSIDTALHVYFRRGSALVNMQNYERALSDLNFVFEIHNKKMPLANSDFLSLCKNLAYSHKQLGNWRSCLGYTQLALDVMAVNDGKFDEFLPTILILYADAQYALGNRRKAHRALNKILSQQENDTQALERKQAWKKAGWLSFFNSK